MTDPTPTMARTAVLPLLLLAATGCTGRQGHIDDRKVSERYPLPAGTEVVRVDILEGGVTFKTGEPGEVAVHVDVRVAAVEKEHFDALRAVDPRPVVVAGDEPGVFVLRGPQYPAGCERPADQIITRCVVLVPPDVAVEGVTNARGHMAAEGRRARVRLETPHGDLRLRDCRGAAFLRSGRGAVLVDGLRGDLDVELGVWRGERVKIYEEEGQVMQVFLAELGPNGVQIVTPNSGVQLHLPHDASFEMNVWTDAGRVRNGFGIAEQTVSGSKFKHFMRGKVGGGGPPVKIVAERGNLSVSAKDYGDR